MLSSRVLAPHLLITLPLLLAPARSLGAGGEAVQFRPARAALQRLIPSLEQQFSLVPLERADGCQHVRVSGSAGHIEIAATSNVAALFGVNWYLKYEAHLQISTNGDQLGSSPQLPAPATPIEKTTCYPVRYALNENTDGYSTPYWDWDRWQREIDVLAASGVNVILVERGMDAVLDATFRDFGYSDAEIRQWITQPAHQNWELMGNLCCFDEPISRRLLDRRVRSARRIVARLRELGITPVFPGFYGLVPADFAQRHPGTHVVQQGSWNGFRRPGWLDPRDPLFASVAASFYRHQRQVFGDSTIYDMELFQEGGTPGNVPVGPASHAVQQALLRAHPDALWMTLAWQSNPSPQLLSAVDRNHMLIIDLDQGRAPRDERERDFMGAGYLFGGLWDFGGRTTLGANLYDYAVRLPEMGRRPGSRMQGTALFSEGLDNNPVAFDLFTEMAWRDKPVDRIAWSVEYARRRYGLDDLHARRAWKIMMETAYGSRADGVSDHGERDAPPESLFDALPSLAARSASTWSPDSLRYDPAQFNPALTELLQVDPRVRNLATYRYDVVDVARQTLANWSRKELPQIRNAFEGRDQARLHELERQWLAMMDLQDKLLATNTSFMVGPWLQAVSPWAGSAQERRRLDYDARSILTTWGDRTASEAGLRDYGNKDWAGLTRDYYRERWRIYFDDLNRCLALGTSPQPIDWFAVGERWNRAQTQYPVQPRGDSWSAALQVARALGIAPPDVHPTSDGNDHSAGRVRELGEGRP
jgi:alpha-N-acetylglucosaminidase